MKRNLKLTMDSGEMVMVNITVHAFPDFPTPGEPDVKRGPTLEEFIEILNRLQTLEFEMLP